MMNSDFLSFVTQRIVDVVCVGLLIILLFYVQKILTLLKLIVKKTAKRDSISIKEDSIANISNMVFSRIKPLVSELIQKDHMEIEDQIQDAEITQNNVIESLTENSSKFSSTSRANLQYDKTDIGKKTALYNQIRQKKLSEDTLHFARVRLEFIEGSSLTDLGRERYFEEHSSGNCIIIQAADGKILLFPHFRKKELEEELVPYFNGKTDFDWISRPAICERVRDGKYKVIEKGSIQ